MTNSFRNSINSTMRKLLTEYNGLIFGQNLTDVGWVAGTLPELPSHPGYVELPISDIAGPGLAVGAALTRRPVVYISRYQGYLWLNMAPIATYAALARKVFDQDCKIMFRSIADDGAWGPVASGSHFSIALQVPSLKVVAPICPKHWENIWHDFITNNDPIFVAEHRGTYELEKLKVYKDSKPQIVVLFVSSTWLSADNLSEMLKFQGIKHYFENIYWIRPVKVSPEILSTIKQTQKCLIVDPCSENSGVGRRVQSFIEESCPNSQVKVVGNDESFAGYSKVLRSKVISSETIFNALKSMF